MPKLSLAKLERHLYSAADRLRQEGFGRGYVQGLYLRDAFSEAQLGCI
jgi:hypothetical protein